MKKVLSKRLLVFLTVLFVLCAAFAALSISESNTAHAANELVVGSDARNLYDGNWTTSYNKTYASSKYTGTGSETLSGGNYSWSGATKNSALNFQIDSGATFSMTVTNMVNPEHIVYSRFMIGKTKASHNVTASVSFGNKNDSVGETEISEEAEESYAAAAKASDLKMTITFVAVCLLHIVGIFVLIILLVKRRKDKKEEAAE